MVECFVRSESCQETRDLPCKNFAHVKHHIHRILRRGEREREKERERERGREKEGGGGGR